MISAVAQALELGTVLAGRYRIEAPVAGGGMGSIYRATHLQTHREVALKVMHAELVADPDLRMRFEREAQVTARIRSDHLVQILDAGIDAATQIPFLVMELLDGEDLASVLAKSGRLPPEQATSYLRQAALALDRLHAEGVIHRDLKPENMFITRRDDGSPCVKLIDFGIAKRTNQQTGARTTRVGGTPLYMSPEQILGEGNVDARADIYALGHIAFELLVGSPFFTCEAEELAAYPFLRRVLEGASETASLRAVRLSGRLHPGFDAWFAQSTAIDRRARFVNAAAQIDALEALLAGELPASTDADPLAETVRDDDAEVGNSWSVVGSSARNVESPAVASPPGAAAAPSHSGTVSRTNVSVATFGGVTAQTSPEAPGPSFEVRHGAGTTRRKWIAFALVALVTSAVVAGSWLRLTSTTAGAAAAEPTSAPIAESAATSANGQADEPAPPIAEAAATSANGQADEPAPEPRVTTTTAGATATPSPTAAASGNVPSAPSGKQGPRPLRPAPPLATSPQAATTSAPAETSPSFLEQR